MRSRDSLFFNDERNNNNFCADKNQQLQVENLAIRRMRRELLEQCKWAGRHGRQCISKEIILARSMFSSSVETRKKVECMRTDVESWYK